MSDFVAIDFETANSDQASACSLGLVRCNGTDIIGKDYFLIRPKNNHFSGFNTLIHGITAEDVENEPTFDRLFDRFLDFVGDSPIVAHNAAFDMSVLRHMLDLYNIKYPNVVYTCTLQIARRVWRELYSFRLQDVSDYLGIKFNHHDALEDARACALIALYAMKIQTKDNVLELARGLGISPKIISPEELSMSFRSSKRIRSKEKYCIVESKKSDFDHDHPLFGKTVAITLDLYSMKRPEAAQKIVDLGGHFANSISKKVDFLVVGGGFHSLAGTRGGTTKINKVRELRASGSNIEVIFEDDLLGLLSM